MEKIQCISLFPISCQSQEGYFLDFHSENLMGFQEIKPIIMRRPPKTEDAQSVSLKLAHAQPSVIHQNYHLSGPISL